MLRLTVDLDGEKVVGVLAHVGYLHTGFEKNMEQKSWWKAITYPPRIDYLSFQINELVFVLAVEKLLEIEVPEKATWMRTLLSELNRIHSHLIWLGTSALEIGAISLLFYCFRDRDAVLDLFELVTGVRMHTRYFQAGGLAEDIPQGFYAECRKFCEYMPKAIGDYENLLTRNPLWLERIAPSLVDLPDNARVHAASCIICGRCPRNRQPSGPASPCGGWSTPRTGARRAGRRSRAGCARRGP